MSKSDGPSSLAASMAEAAQQVTAEAAAHAVLRLVADMPGQMGRLRASRVVGGYHVPTPDELIAHRLRAYALELPWGLRDTVELVDALLDGGLMAQTIGQRPTLVLTRSGHRALEALESGTGDTGITW
jgi:hypothetical protein